MQTEQTEIGNGSNGFSKVEIDEKPHGSGGGHGGHEDEVGHFFNKKYSCYIVFR
jgi:hypothetical protein